MAQNRTHGEQTLSERRPIAAALRYDARTDGAPRVTARGQGLLAEKIIALAREHHVPIQKDPALVQMLSKLELDEEIPAELYRAVAEVLAFVYRMNSQWRDREDG